ncbi:hypothetical protein BU24DRAFT_11536 [Aaosphaeria arxii CBS 175.79]|uniref:Zn(2)-C6 fungal-type domain-containing protein n=1 Tax=Aaosphaeria arxii CBS 175.79 TaxID=1450172 RepID=A0A6A5Y5X0_9PLEO|nr:uncharacterized protein BU24DRAFT_11536 [Aaosphaeria arxii CBS 175.79]KAF2020942.1 hypothetical protein BU24DRAFT_11536 [Aaosphaeria arxii CBS 175.79]
MQNFGNDQLATRTCWQCKSSKKKCDKLLPTCSRCSRLSIECAYDGEKPDAAPSNHDSNDTKFEQIFQRLERLEHLISNPDSPTTTRTSASHEPPPSYVSNIDHSCQPPSWQVDPGQLKQEYVGFMLWGSVFRIMSESHTTIDAVADNYFKWTHQWLPMISRSRFDTGLERLKVYSTDRGSSLTILAMHLTVTPVSEHPGSTPLSDSPWYRACKYYFSYFASVEEPTVDIIQAGILLALFEHMQSIDNKALTTLGICGRLACALDLDDIVAQALIREPGEISSEVEEAIQTWFALILLDRFHSSLLSIRNHSK